jgi:hypothetical protein
VAVLIAVAAGCGPAPEPPGFSDGPHAGDVVVGSDERHGGSLAAEFDFDSPVEVAPSATLGGFDLYTATEPGFDVLVLDEPAESFFVLEEGTDVTFEVVEIDAGAAVKLGEAILDEPGDSALLGVAPELHLHPEWQLVVPVGEEPEDAHVTFRLTTTSEAYAASEEYVLTLAASHVE